ncbi:hypothetical protein PHAVU_002G332600 [Phaseolus vulgaris]|uniref:Uncharacterized protein n=1 Tax=Phaseolus vulgaris TaxID=3885 RepID=V7CUH9_PHAVU|nr:hypothetical protein PHAVU_002G332600g [Phaseolus vulgaris]ESW32561.1 hypothetical protein PHAVU_002G332600g [Phaseolus vulgaris]
MTATVSMGMGVGKVSAFNNYPFPLLSSAPILNPFPSSRTTFSVLQAANANANANANSNADAYANSPYPHAHHFDPELRSVLELATDSELLEIEDILFGASYFSPLLKSIPFSNTTHLQRSMIGVDLSLRLQFIEALESRFFFLAADARSTLRGWRPSYRNVLLHIRTKFDIPCSTRLPTPDLELEIFLHLLHCNSTEEPGTYPALFDQSTASEGQGTLQHGLSPWKLHSKVGAQDIRSSLLKGGGVFTLAKIYQLLARKLSGKVLVEAANYQVKKELVKKGGQLAMINLESRAALLAAKQGFLGAASRYLGFRSMLTLLGPVLWGTFLADVVIQMLGTDYARILRTIYAFAQIRVIRTYRLPSDVTDE